MEDAVPEASRRHPEGRVGKVDDPPVPGLSSGERSALKELGYDPLRREIPPRDSLRLLELGLAELSCGRLVLTQAGRVALAKIRDK